jgi:molybdenum cofactor biosynthesis enzyme MoaA
VSAATTNAHYNPITNDFAIVDDGKHGLPQVMWHVTDRCPLDCPYCFATKSGLDADVTRLDRIIEVFKEIRVQKVDIAGGEPLIWNQLSSTATSLAEAGFFLTLTTSGIGFESQRRWLIDRADLFSRIIISIDGPSDIEHDALRRNPGTFAKAKILISELHEASYTKVRINTVLVRPMTDDKTLQRLASTISSMGPEEWCIIQPHPANQKPDFHRFALDSTTFNEAVTYLKRIAQSHSLPIGHIISRSVQQYEGYWVLYPDGILRRHTSGSEDCAEISLLGSLSEDIIAAVQHYGFNAPMRRL